MGNNVVVSSRRAKAAASRSAGRVMGAGTACGQTSGSCDISWSAMPEHKASEDDLTVSCGPLHSRAHPGCMPTCPFTSPSRACTPRRSKTPTVPFLSKLTCNALWTRHREIMGRASCRMPPFRPLSQQTSDSALCFKGPMARRPSLAPGSALTTEHVRSCAESFTSNNGFQSCRGTANLECAYAPKTKHIAMALNSS